MKLDGRLFEGHLAIVSFCNRVAACLCFYAKLLGFRPRLGQRQSVQAAKADFAPFGLTFDCHSQDPTLAAAHGHIEIKAQPVAVHAGRAEVLYFLHTKL